MSRQASIVRGSIFLMLLLAIGALAHAAPQSGELSVGAAAISITPDKPAPLMGQMHLRVSKSVESPITAQALALETRRVDIIKQAIVSSPDKTS